MIKKEIDLLPEANRIAMPKQSSCFAWLFYQGEWFLDENGNSKQLMRGERCQWEVKILDISVLIEVRSPSLKIISWGQRRGEMWDLAKEIAYRNSFVEYKYAVCWHFTF